MPSDYMTGDDDAYLWITINNRRLWLDDYAVDNGVVAGFDGDSEQCETCGHDIQEHGELQQRGQQRLIRCRRCGTEYTVRYDQPERGGPPYDAATATGMYDWW